jgi:hypothetical protein
MCAANLWPAVVCLVAGHALVVLLARLDAWRETKRKQRWLDEALTRHEQAQHRWVESVSVDVERREA